MKAYSFLAVLVVLLSCNSHSSKEKVVLQPVTIKVHDTIYLPRDNYDWQEDFGITHEPDKDSIWNKPVNYYINDKDCSGLALDFYYGKLRPSDDGSTTELLKLAVTDNKKLRPFYRWCLNKTLIVSDGALGELTGVPARQYAEKFPDEFFEYLDSTDDGSKYKMWTEAIAYSGFYDYNDYDNNKVNQKKLEKKMLGNLKWRTSKNILRVKKFAKDCTSLVL
jgi:hypothetical protein